VHILFYLCENEHRIAKWYVGCTTNHPEAFSSHEAKQPYSFQATQTLHFHINQEERANMGSY